MINADEIPKKSECKPYNTMGTVWICNLMINHDCPFALSFGYVVYCNNRSLHKVNGKS